MRRLGLVVLPLLAACGEPAEPAAPRAESTPAAPDATAALLPGAAATAAAPKVTLFTDGVILEGADAVQLRFGQPRDSVVAEVGGVLGTPETSTLDECGAGPMAFAAFDGLTLNFLDGIFVGWRATDGADVVTADGVMLGTALGAIKRERSAALVSQSTLEGEFEYASGDGGTIGGFLAGEGDAARVTALHAGVNCFFR